MENLVSSLLLTISSDSETPLSSSAHTTHTWFQWGGTVFAISVEVEQNSASALCPQPPSALCLLPSAGLPSAPSALCPLPSAALSPQPSALRPLPSAALRPLPSSSSSSTLIDSPMAGLIWLRQPSCRLQPSSCSTLNETSSSSTLNETSTALIIFNGSTLIVFSRKHLAPSESLNGSPSASESTCFLQLFTGHRWNLSQRLTGASASMDKSNRNLSLVRFLLILNRLARPSPTQTALLVTYLLSSLPTVLFNIVRGEFGCWVAFFAVVAHLLFPREFPVSRFLLFVIMPSWVARKLHDSILGGILCLIIGVLLLIDWIRGIEDSSNCGRDLCYCIGISFLCIFAISYLWKGSW